jgi:ribonuclease III
MSRPHPDDLCRALGVQLSPGILERALTHRSYAFENGGLPTNERLEFLGDSVLGLVITDALFQRHPDMSEGQLAKVRAAIVNSRALAEVGRALDVGSHLRLGKGEETTGGRDKSSILADTVEALIGAVYLDRGAEVATDLILRLFDDLLLSAANLGAGLDWKTSLQELTAMHDLGVPQYLVEESGPDHAKAFTARVQVGQLSYGQGHGRSKKEAEQQAASSAYNQIMQTHGFTDAAAAHSIVDPVDPLVVAAGAPDSAGVLES